MALEDIGVRATIDGLAGFKRGVSDMEGGVSSLGRTIERQSRNFKVAGAALTAMAVGAAFVGFKFVQAASDAEEMRSKFNVVFGELADGVAAWAQETATAVNRSQYDFVRWLAALQDTFVPLGYARDQAAEFSKQLVTLAVDVASFNNAVEADVIRDFQSALVGNTETVRKYGIILTEANTKQEIYNQGWADSDDQITDAMKVQARLNIIMAGTSDAQGDAARTAESFANQMRGLQAQVQQLSIALGQQLLPIAKDIVGAIRAMVEWVNQLPEGLVRVSLVVGGLATAFGLIAGPILLFLGFLPQIVTGLTLVFGAVSALKTLLTGPLGLAQVAVALAAGAAAVAGMKAIGAFQTGGTIGATGMALVGERGPELVRLPAASQVTPVSRSVSYNVTANYSNPQQPQGIRMDLEALAMMARR